MPRASLLTATLATLALMAVTAGSAAADPAYVPGELIVKREGARAATTVAVRDGRSVKDAARALSDRPGVAYARPNYIAHATAYTPNDPGFPLQWNLATSAAGINMPEAWGIARQLGRSGGKDTIVAVLDTGVAYQRFRRFRRAPDLNRFVRGYDFVADDRHPNDQNGHGTHVAGTIAQSTGNATAAAGIAYRARIMPVRVLDASGAGDTLAISRGIRFAARRGADVVNLSLEFDAAVRAAQIPDIVSALEYARSRGAIVIAAAGNQGSPQVAYPARAPRRCGRRDDSPRLPGRVLEQRRPRRHRRPRRRRRRGEHRHPVRHRHLPARPARRVHLPADLRRQRRQVRPAARLRGHVDGGAARLRRGRAADRQPAPGAQSQPGGGREAAQGDGPRHRLTRLGRQVRLGPARRGRSAQVVRIISTLHGA